MVEPRERIENRHETAGAARLSLTKGRSNGTRRSGTDVECRRLAYPVRDGIPIMLQSEARALHRTSRRARFLAADH